MTGLNWLFEALITACLSAFLALGVREMTENRTRAAMSRNCIVSAILGIFTGLGISFLGGVSVVAMVLTGFVAGTSVGIWSYAKEQQHASKLLTQAHNVQMFLGKLFASAAEGALLKPSDLQNRIDEATDLNEKFFLGFLIANIADIGHKIGTHVEYIVVGYGSSSMPAQIAVADYAIGHEDMETLKQRLWTKYGNWLPGNSGAMH